MKNSKGYSMLEAVMTMVVIAIIGLGLATLMAQSGRQNRTVTLVSDYNELVQEVRAVMADGPLCTQALYGETFDTLLPVTLKLPAPTNTTGTNITGGPLKANDKYRSITVTALQFARVQSVWTGAPPPACAPTCNGRRVGFIYLESDFNSTGFLSFGVGKRGVYIPVYADTDAAHKIISCLGKSGDGPLQLCMNLGGIYTAPALGKPGGCTLPANAAPTGMAKTFTAAVPGGVNPVTATPYEFCALSAVDVGAGSAAAHSGCAISKAGTSWTLTATNATPTKPLTCTMVCAP